MVRLIKTTSSLLLSIALLVAPNLATAALTVGSTSVTSDAGLTLSGAVGSAISLGTTATTGTLTVGGTTQTGNIVIGQSTQNNYVKIASGVPASGKVTVVEIAKSDGVSGSNYLVDIANGYGSASGVVRTVNIANGGNATVEIGNTQTATTVTIQAGPTGYMWLNPTSSAYLWLGGFSQTGDTLLGFSSATNIISIGSAATSNGNTQTINIGGGNASGTGIKAINIATGTPATSGNNRVTIGGGSTSAVTINAPFSSYKAMNYISSETGGNNAIAGALTNASGTNITLAEGLAVSIKLAHTLQAGANTFDLNGGGAVAIKKHTNPASDLSTAYASGGIIQLIYDGSVWQDMSQ